MIPRQAHQTLLRLSQGFPVVAITGPRQSGKTTLARAVFPEKPYVSLENPDTRIFAETDPRGFLGNYPDGAIFDEIQRCPDLFSYLQGIVDDDRRMGLFVLTGSQQFGLRTHITQSLAGRVGMVQLLPFSLAELSSAGKQPSSIEATIFTGAYPPLFDRLVSPSDWYPGYVATYVERDLHQLINIRDLTAFQRFLRMCANRIGQLVNLSSLANDCGITHNTAKAWISVLEASYMIFQLQPHHQNFNKRLTKSAKLYFCDTGLASWLLGIQNADQINAHALRGALFENWVISELLKARFNQGQPSNLYFWRDSTGNEVDVIIEQGEQLTPVEIKSGKTLNNDYFAGLKKWCALAGDAVKNPTLIYAGDEQQSRSTVDVIPWDKVGGIA
jgi:uncharacterized protein